jgi:thioredoxin reductase (NADPH)
MPAKAVLRLFRARTIMLDFLMDQRQGTAGAHAAAGIPLRSGISLRRVERLEKATAGFLATTQSRSVTARSVLLATGVTNIAPRMPAEVHDEALSGRQLRYCPVCDGYEASGQRIAVIGTGARGAKEAEFLRSYSDDVTLIGPHGPHALEPSERDRLNSLGVAIITR